MARLNWEITKKKPLIDLHKQLLTLPNYYFFENLEGANYNPHISLGAVDMEKSSNYNFVKEYLENQQFETYKFQLKDIEINITSPESSETVSLSI